MSCSFGRVITSTFETAQTEKSASPRNPKVAILLRSSSTLILLVALRKNAFLMSSFSIPQPSSLMRIYETPPFLISIVTFVAPASIEFSTSSFITELGRSTTSPAAISSAMCLSKTFIFPTIIFLYKNSKSAFLKQINKLKQLRHGLNDFFLARFSDILVNFLLLK